VGEEGKRSSTGRNFVGVTWPSKFGPPCVHFTRRGVAYRVTLSLPIGASERAAALGVGCFQAADFYRFSLNLSKPTLTGRPFGKRRLNLDADSKTAEIGRRRR